MQDTTPGLDIDTAQRIAERVRDVMRRDDHASRALGIDIIAVGPGSSRATMTVRQDMLNGFAICHGGLITALADSAFAFACNAYNDVTVAAGVSIDFLAPARIGDRLEAECRERALGGRTGIYDVTVRNQHGQEIALFRGRSHRLTGRTVFDAGARDSVRN